MWKEKQSCGSLGNVSDGELRVGGLHLAPLLVGEPKEAGEGTLGGIWVFGFLLLPLVGRTRTHTGLLIQNVEIFYR